MIKGAIFDVDGTLLDSMHIWDMVGSEYLISQGCTPEKNLNELFKTFSLSQAAEYFIKNYGINKSVDEICNGVNAMVEDGYKNQVLIKPGIETLLYKLKQNGVKMCVATATDKYLVEAALQRNGILSYFDEIFTCPDLGYGKDEPIIYRECLKFLGTKRENTLVFEDVLYAVNTAKNDGFNVVAVYDKHEKNQTQLIKTADIFLPNYTDLDEFWEYAFNL